MSTQTNHKLLDEVRDYMRLHHYSIHSERTYCDWIKRFVKFHGMKSRKDLSDGEKKIVGTCGTSVKEHAGRPEHAGHPMFLLSSGKSKIIICCYFSKIARHTFSGHTSPHSSLTNFRRFSHLSEPCL